MTAHRFPVRQADILFQVSDTTRYDNLLRNQQLACTKGLVLVRIKT
jgi:hypothetical protein